MTSGSAIYSYLKNYAIESHKNLCQDVRFLDMIIQIVFLLTFIDFQISAIL